MPIFQLLFYSMITYNMTTEQGSLNYLSERILKWLTVQTYSFKIFTFSYRQSGWGWRSQRLSMCIHFFDFWQGNHFQSTVKITPHGEVYTFPHGSLMVLSSCVMSWLISLLSEQPFLFSSLIGVPQSRRDKRYTILVQVFFVSMLTFLIDSIGELSVKT